MGTKITPFNLHTSVDSHVKGLIDSDYIQARSGSGGTDSASTQAMIDSNFANDVTFGKGITVTGGNSGDVLLTFATDRSWQFQQSGDDAQTQLQLKANTCLLYTSPSPRDRSSSRMPSSA